MDRTRSVPETPRELQFALARQFHKDTAAGALGHPVAGAVMAFLVWGAVPDWMALGTVLLIAVASWIRIRLHQSAATIGELGKLIRRTRASTLVVAGAWAVSALIVVPRIGPEAEGRVLVIFAGLVAIGTATHMADRTGFLAFVGLFLGSLLVAIPFSGLDRLLGVDMLLILVFGIMITLIHARMHEHLRTILASDRSLRATTRTATRERKFLDAVLRGAPEGVLLLNQEGCIAKANLQAERILGLPESELLGACPRLEGERGPLWVALHEAAAAAGTEAPSEIEVEFTDDRGETVFLQVSGILGRDAAAGWTVIQLQDLTGLRAAEAARRTAEAEYAELVESARDLIWKVDREGRWTFLNQAAEALYGTSPEALLGTSALARAPEDRVEDDRTAFQTVLRGEELVNYETEHLTVDGEPRTLSFSARPLRDYATGEIEGIQGVARDVTAEARAREAVRDLAERTSLVRSLINASKDLIFYKDSEGVYRGCNDAFARFHGLTEDELVGLTDGDLVGADVAARFRATDEEVLRTREPVSFEYAHTGPDGEERLSETVKSIYQDAEGNVLGILGVVRDVTERKRNEERIREMANEAERAARMKSAFLANMSHEIRTPMNGVLGMAELLQFTSLNDEQRQYVDVIRSSADNLLGILNDILDISKIEAEKLELEIIPLDLSRVLADALRLLSLPAARRRNELLLDMDRDVPRWVRGDPGRLRQVVTNLVSNAIKFTEDGEVLVTVERLDNGGGHPMVRIGVRDSGIGIPPEKHDAIFHEFEQADTSVTRRYGGTGLGLAISRRLVQLMGGRMGLESTPGEGSHFWMDLPLQPTAPQPAEPGEEPVPDDLSGVAALIVDDHATNRDILRRILEGVGAEVEEAESGQVALDRLERGRRTGDSPDVILLDVQMPDMDGMQVAEHILSGPDARIPLVILTSANRLEDARRARDLGIVGYHLKPIPRDDLLRAVGAAVHRTGERRSDAAGRMAAMGTGEGAGEHILLAEDNLVNQLVARSILEKAGYRVTAVETGTAALEQARSGSVDLVLMDVQMPEMDGLEATRRLREEGRGLPVVALTAHAFGEEEARCRAAGMDAFLSKPFHAHDLLRTVATWIARTAPDAGSGDGEDRESADAGVEIGTAKAEHEEGGSRSADGDPPVDLDRFRTNLREAGIEAVAEPTLQLFLGDLRERRVALEASRGSSDLTELARVAHALKSGCGNVCAGRARDLLESLETRADAGDVGILGDPVDEVLRELGRVERYLESEGVTGAT